jgi:hypothetical protein
MTAPLVVTSSDFRHLNAALTDPFVGAITDSLPSATGKAFQP